MASLHMSLGGLGLLATVLWFFVALLGAVAADRLSGMQRGAYLATMILTGLSGVSGVVVTVTGDWYGMIYPYLGLVAVAVHGVAGKRSRKAVVGGRKGTAAMLIGVQIVMLVFAAAIMARKPF